MKKVACYDWVSGSASLKSGSAVLYAVAMHQRRFAVLPGMRNIRYSSGEYSRNNE